MAQSPHLLTRREALNRGLAFAAAAAALAGLPLRLMANELASLDVAYAGSMGSMMEGPIKSAAARALKIDFHGRAQGSSALAQRGGTDSYNRGTYRAEDPSNV